MAIAFSGFSGLFRAALAFGLLLVVPACDGVVVVSDSDDPVSSDASPSPGSGARGERPVVGATTTYRRVFVTSTAYTGALGGISGADDLCDEAAEDAGLSGTWRAWLGTYTTPVSERLVHESVPYVRLDGATIASDWDDLIDGTLGAAIGLDEYGVSIDPANSFVWTATDASGDPMGGTCQDWSDSNSGGFYGSALAADDGWAHTACQPCTMTAHLYCFEE